MLHITRRDTVKRLSSLGLVLLVCLQAVPMDQVALLLGAVLMTEVFARIGYHITPDRDENISLSLVLATWLNNSLSTFFFLTPSVLLASQPSVPLLLSGFVWMFGVFVHISNTFMALPWYNWSQMIPGGIALGLLMWAAQGQGFAAGAHWEWIIAAAVMIVYASNTVQTLIMQKDTQKALAAARAEANARLATLEQLTRVDGLTGLLNRRAFDEGLAGLLDQHGPGSDIAVFLVDLDGFKPINDSYSHDAGDHVLMATARRLQRLAGERGLAARLGGDEFALAMPGLRHGRLAETLAHDIATEIEAPILYEGRTLRIGASIGIGLTGLCAPTVVALCAGADQAMYKAKNDPAAKIALFDPETFGQRATLQDRARLVAAMHAGQLRPYYQPKFCLSTGRLRGFEALARWEHPAHGVLLPVHFLAQINDLGLQGDFLNHIAAQALRDITELIDEGLDPGQVSINVPEMTLATHSGRQDLTRLLERFPGAARHLTFEITEDVFIARSGDFIQSSIAHFRAMGVRISLDDFGTGFASFQHLRELEFDELKIDQSFVADLVHDRSAEVLVTGFLNIANGLGVDVIAEGVETEDQRDRLIELGARLGQGWLFGRAEPLASARARLTGGQGVRAAG